MTMPLISESFNPLSIALAMIGNDSLEKDLLAEAPVNLMIRIPFGLVFDFNGHVLTSEFDVHVLDSCVESKCVLALFNSDT